MSARAKIIAVDGEQYVSILDLDDLLRALETEFTARAQDAYIGHDLVIANSMVSARAATEGVRTALSRWGDQAMAAEHPGMASLFDTEQ